MPVAAELTCQEVVELVTEYLDGALPDDELERFELHLLYCGPCATHVEQMRETIRVAGAVHADDLDPTVADDLLEAFRSWHEGTA
jgi:anti-sigma factor RsiW